MAKYDQMYMDFADRLAKESKCPRRRVGCVVLLSSGMLAPGFNGHACGGPNEWEYSDEPNPEVIHAELNAFGKMLEQGISASGATVYVTLSPCIECAKLLKRAKVARVVYKHEYRLTDGLDYLRKYKVEVEHFSEEARFRKQWAGRIFMCPKTGEQLVVPNDVREGQYFVIGDQFLDVGRLDAYHRRSPALVEID